MPLSPLPDSLRPWSVAILNAYRKLNHIYQTASSYMESGNVEAHRLQQYGRAIIVDAYPLLVLLEESANSESLPLRWIEDVATEFTALLALVDDAWISAKAEYVTVKKSWHLYVNKICYFLDQLPIYQSLSLYTQYTWENEADPGNMLTPWFFTRLSKRDDRFLLLF